MNKLIKIYLVFIFSFLLISCASGTKILYSNNPTISKVDLTQGYRLRNRIANDIDENLIIILFSGGGTRAAALGYGLLEELNSINLNGRKFINQIDVVYGISGGAVLAAYFSLHGENVIPKFENNFLKKNFQDQLINQLFSFANFPKLSSPQFGRGELLQEQFNKELFANLTFADLQKTGLGPFAVITATDMSNGEKISFTQDFFDVLCLDLNKMEIARAVASSSSVPLVFAPLTLNNNGGNCAFSDQLFMTNQSNNLKTDRHILRNQKEKQRVFSVYQNAKLKPYIHLLDGGLADNLGLSSFIDIYDYIGSENINSNTFQKSFKRIVIISVNAQNKMDNFIDKTANIPAFSAVVNSVINIPIDKNTENSLRRFRSIVNEWNKEHESKIYFVSLSLEDLPAGELKHKVQNISTSYYLPAGDINLLKSAAKILIRQSEEFSYLLNELKY